MMHDLGCSSQVLGGNSKSAVLVTASPHEMQHTVTIWVGWELYI